MLDNRINSYKEGPDENGDLEILVVGLFLKH